MEKFTDIRIRMTGLTAVLLILVQSVFAAGLPASCAHKEDICPSHKTEVKQEVAVKASYVVVNTRITVVAFLYGWLTKVFTIDVPLIAYHNCEAFFINPYFFHVFYTCLRALAP